MEFLSFDVEENGNSNSKNLVSILNESNVEQNQEQASRECSSSFTGSKKHIQKNKKNIMNYTDLVCKDYYIQYVSQKRYGQNKLDDTDYWPERSNFLQYYRPTCKIQKFDQYSVYHINNSANGLSDFNIPFKILERIKYQCAFKMIDALKYALQQFQ
ncbi:hypothetical protein ABPG72_002057 [Tetrahymena utriculariae]